MRFFVCTAMILICSNLHAQTPPARPEFEVASVKPAANDGPGIGRPPMFLEMMRNNRQPGAIPMTDPGRIRLEDWALLDLIAAAYRVRAPQVSGPAWLADQGFDIEAKLPEGTPKEELNGMLQALLEERFGLKVHRETLTKSGFALVVGKNGPKLKAAEPPQNLSPEERLAKMKEQMAVTMRGTPGTPEGGPPLGLSTSSWTSVTTEELAARLVRFTDAPVVDETGLKEKYSVVIQTWKNADVPGGTVFDAVEKLGLKLAPRKVTVETVVVDRVSKMPTAN
jgi:uncharacterized protein (TIGR03435 family)